MSFSDEIKAKIKDAEIEKHLSSFINEAEEFVDTSVGKAGSLAHDKRDNVEEWLDKATTKVNEKTDGKYADAVAKVRQAVLTSVDKVAEKRPSDTTAEDATPSAPKELGNEDVTP